MRPLTLLLAASLALAACSSDEDPAPTAAPVGCSAGQQIECTCVGGSKSAQVCKADGSGFDACACGAAGAGGGSGSGGGAGSGGMCQVYGQTCDVTLKPCCQGMDLTCINGVCLVKAM